ncbi:TPA: ABC transporter permease [Staphylococcus aureus]|nr:ABC transporter permease [Staphylococcus aureus]HDH2384213.1 ABC transporter permease [Staphylococcus aureus]HDH2397131.1 ABC transporter permease [Staphylococcus aureus]
MKILAIVRRVLKEMLRDKRTLALMFLAPILILTLMYFIFNGDENDLKIGIDTSVSSNITKQLPSSDIKTQTFHSHENIKSKIENNHLDGYIYQENQTLHVIYTNEDPNKSKIENNHLDGYIYQENQTLHVIYTNEDPNKSNMIKQMIGKAIQQDKISSIKHLIEKAPPTMKAPNKQDIKISHSYLYGNSDSTYFDKMFPILMGFFVFLFVFLISGIALLRERTTGTLERVLSTSIRRSEIVLGYLIGYGIFAIIQTLIIVLFSIYLLNINLAGSLWYVILINICLAITALSMGIFISTFANSEFQMIQFIPLVAVPQVFFSGIFPLENMPDWLGNIGYIFPLRYAGDALTNVMIKGQGWSNIWFDLLILMIFIMAFIILNIVGLKRYRQV